MERLKEDYLGKGFVELNGDLDYGSAISSMVLGNLSEGVYTFLRVVSTDSMIAAVEFFLPAAEELPLQEVYDSEVSDIVELLIGDSLQRSGAVLRPTPTPLTSDQDRYYPTLAAWLLTESEANSLYAPGIWQLLEDRVGATRVQVCRLFEDRTGPDTRFVGLRNCVYWTPGYDIEQVRGNYGGEIELITLQSKYVFKGQSLLLGYQDPETGNTVFDLWAIREEYLYRVAVNMKTYLGDSTEELFTEFVDDFLYEVLTINWSK
ncbi:MAG: hypothetical protein EPO32_12695 [Anaerolineae bacterium]|nr:MAG: hypothetical protein EPO32_12695 [Anaerolineae bacterium]